jgi:hypothetical protein
LVAAGSAEQCCIVVLLFALARNVLRVFCSLYKATSVICGHQHTHTNTHTHTHIPFKVLRTNSTKRAAKSVCVKLIHVTAREREGGREGRWEGGREGGREGVRKGCEKKLEVGVRKIHERENSRAMHACTHEQNCTLRACTALCLLESPACQGKMLEKREAALALAASLSQQVRAGRHTHTSRRQLQNSTSLLVCMNAPSPRPASSRSSPGNAAHPLLV